MERQTFFHAADRPCIRLKEHLHGGALFIIPDAAISPS